MLALALLSDTHDRQMAKLTADQNQESS